MFRMKQRLFVSLAISFCSGFALAAPPFPSLNVTGRYACYSINGPMNIAKTWSTEGETAMIIIASGAGRLSIQEFISDKSTCSLRDRDEINWSSAQPRETTSEVTAEFCITPYDGGDQGWVLLKISAEAPSFALLQATVESLYSAASCHVGRTGANGVIFHGDTVTVFRQILGKRLERADLRN